MWALLARTIAATRHLATDERIPKGLRWAAAIGLLPIPGPLDEAVLLVIAPILAIFYREPMRDAWQRSSRRG